MESWNKYNLFSRRFVISLLFIVLSLVCTFAVFFPPIANLSRSFQQSKDTFIGKSASTGQSMSNQTLRELVVKNKLGLSETHGLINTSVEKQESEAPPPSKPSQVVTEDPELLIDRRVAEEVSKKVRVLCWIPSREIYLDTRLKAVNDTWVHRCDKLIYIITNPSKKYTGVVAVNIPDERKTLTEKSVFANKYIYTHYLEQFDWFLKADDDTYVIMENLKFLLSHFEPSIPGYIGCQLTHWAPQGFMSGGAGYLFNREGLRLLVEKGYRVPGRCRLAGGSEDAETGRCAYKVGIRFLSQLDQRHRETFFPNNVFANFVGPHSLVTIYIRSQWKSGKKCCSELLISLHKTDPKMMYIIEHLLYRVSIHGRRFMQERADELFKGNEALDMDRSMKRLPYPGEKLDEYYQKDWRERKTKP